MAKLIVKDKNGVEREMTERSFNLAGQKRGWKKIGTVPEPESEIQKLMKQKIAEKAETPTEAKTEVVEKKKPGPKPKTTE